MLSTSNTTDLEKKSLEAHVDLCAQRYRFLETKLDSLETKITKTNETIDDIHAMMEKVTSERTAQLLNWGVGIIASLVATVAFLIVHYAL